MPEEKEAVASFLLKIQAPVVLEGISQLLNDPRLEHLAVLSERSIFEEAKSAGYPIDGVLRIGGIPTHRMWRDLEELEGACHVCSVSRLPFSGLSWTRKVIVGPIAVSLDVTEKFEFESFDKWKKAIQAFREHLFATIQDEPSAEPSMVHALSKLIPAASRIYLGNSLPIREWDFAADVSVFDHEIFASRGVNGIDGQISTFLGLCRQEGSHWGIFGDLTTLYDMAAFWILPELALDDLNVVVINNGGGKIFSRMYPYKEMQNVHDLSFAHLAAMWNLEYVQIEGPKSLSAMPKGNGRRLIEIRCNQEATTRFWEKIKIIEQATPVS
jgi:2-succinyl-5-enolpyruvyl-6-hydroxy-3-cyclohexene-1-carboxylate synthase